MGAGTAQKIVLNMLSTLMAIELGHVHDGMMVNLRADNIKLRARARSIVARVASVEQGDAEAALDTSNGEVKVAILVAAKGIPAGRATEALDLEVRVGAGRSSDGPRRVASVAWSV
jgi:N-acetylmuramic acid 6-phosphate etherase